MRVARTLLLAVVSLTAGLTSTRATAGIQYYVDPVNGRDTNDGTQAPWQTVAHAVKQIVALPPASRAGLTLNLRANTPSVSLTARPFLYPPLALPSTLVGDAAQPIVIQPYQVTGGDGDRVVFDGGDPRFRQPGAWEPVPGQADEWRTTDPPFTFPLAGDPHRVAWGEMRDTKLRLITYGSIDDFRATSESDAAPFAYLGPGLFYVFEDAAKTRGRVHLRLSPTHFNAVGIQDYAGGGDPNGMDLSIACDTCTAGYIGAQNVVFKNLVFRNGGLTTLKVEHAGNLTFDHCEVYGGRRTVRVAGDVSGLKFRHCTFDGGLAPWTTRFDVKEGAGSETHDILVSHAANQSEYVNCTFRRAHDALQLTGRDLEVRDSLFEDINDEVVRLNGPAATPTTPANPLINVKIHGNMIRQALGALSFFDKPTGGPVYFYRNVIDQRVPTRGYRTLPPDAPAPWIWRYGSDFKDIPTLEFHCYQNTFIASNDLDKSSYVSHLFYSDPTAVATFRNNIYLVLDTDITLAHVPASTTALSEGNIWYRYHVNPEPLFRGPLFQSAQGQYSTLDELHADFPNWERFSQIADPLLQNFTDEYFDFASFYPNTDFRPAFGGPAERKGVVLPANLPDDFGPAFGSPPDVGARPITAPVMAVGVDATTLFPTPGVPVALAGSDQTLLDADGDGFELVKLNGLPSQDVGGTITAYTWSIGGRNVANTATAILNLPEGEHYVRLVVTDNAGNVDSDAVRIRVVPATVGENRLTCAGFEETRCTGWRGDGSITSTAPNVHSGSQALRMVANGSLQQIRQRVAISPQAIYTISGWLKTTSVVNPGAALGANLLDGNGAVLQSIVIATKIGNSPYTYYEATISKIPAAAAFLEVMGTLDSGWIGQAFFDDLRIRDRNLLQNGRFEMRAPSGFSRIDTPGWTFGRGGLIVDDPALVRSGRYALGLEPYPRPSRTVEANHIITQRIVHTLGRGYLLSGWVKTVGLGTAPTYRLQFLGASRQNLGFTDIAAVLSEGAYSHVSRYVAPTDIPAGTAMIEVRLMLAEVASGSAYFDDIMVEPVP